MSKLMDPPPHSHIEVITDFLHGVAVDDPYRWLEDPESERTRAWLEQQTLYAHNYLNSIPGRERIQGRIREFLGVETYDSLQTVGGRYLFRKRLPQEEQASIYMRDGAEGEDQLLVDPRERGTGSHTSVKPVRVSPDGNLLLYEVKTGGERTGSFELLDISTRKRLPDLLPRGSLRGFAFGSRSESFYYVHEAVGADRPFYRAAYRHLLGTPVDEDQEIFFAGEDEKIRLGLFSEDNRLVFVVHRFLETTFTDIYLRPLGRDDLLQPIFRGIRYSLGLRLLENRILAITDRDAPNRRIVEIHLRENGEHEWVDIVPETDAPIAAWLLIDEQIVVSYTNQFKRAICIFDLSGQKLRELPISADETVRIMGGSPETDELLLETQSFTTPARILRCSTKTDRRTPWANSNTPIAPEDYGHSEVWYTSKDGTQIPMHLAGRRDVLAGSSSPTIMTSYGGYGVSMTPQFSVFVAFLMERGCVFALPKIRGGSEFGAQWHKAAKRQNRQTAYDDFLSAAVWLVESGRTDPGKLAIFGGSNSGLLVGVALTQRPDLFRAVVCMVPILDMLRYHHFDGAHIWKDELGSVDDPDDFAALAKYSPYHHVRMGTAYPAVMLVSGDSDGNCNALHARKMTARLQAVNVSSYPIFLDYHKFRGHSPVLPLSQRVAALTDRMAFLLDQLELPI